MAVNKQVIEKEYALYNGDCNEVMSELEENSVHMSIYSPPFGGLYNYSSDPKDLSNCNSYKEFLEHYKYIVQNIHRVTMKGRITAVHCTDIPASNSGKDYLIDFPSDVRQVHEDCGFRMIAKHVIWKEPLWVVLV